MSDTDITGFGTQGSQTPLTTGGTPADAAGASPGGLASQTVSTLSPSELKKLEEALFIAAFPFLQPPANLVTFQNPNSDKDAGGVQNATLVTSFAMQMDQATHNIIMDMWDKYAETLDEIKKRHAEEDKKRWEHDADKAGPKSSAEYNAYLLALTPSQRAEEIGPTGNSGLNVEFKTSYSQWVANPASSGSINATGSFPDASFVRGAIASNPDLVSQTIGTVDTATGVQLSVSPVADALFALGPVSALPADTQLASALIAALMYNGASNKATGEAYADASKQAQPIQTIDLAINYAKNILSIISHQAEGGDSAHSQNRFIKLMLATMALTMLHRAIFKGAAAEDLESLIKSNGADIDQVKGIEIPDDIKGLFKGLAANINDLLDANPATKEALLSQIVQYADTKDPVESMVSSGKLLSSMLESPSMSGRILETKQG